MQVIDSGMRLLKNDKRIVAGVLLGVSLIFATPVNAKEIVIPSQPTSTETQQDDNDKKTSEEATTEATTEAVSDGKNGWNSKKTSYLVNGKKVKGFYLIDEKLYYFNNKGVLYTKSGLKKIDGKTYYFDDDHYVLSGVVEIDGKSYYFCKEGGARYETKGLSKVDDKLLCVKSDFSLKSGWYRDNSGKRYYFDKKTYEGLTGWNYVGKYKFFFNKKGVLVQDVRKKLTKAQKGDYTIRVNRTASCVTVYAKDGIKGYTIPVVSFVCSAGHDTPTGTFTIRDKLRWHELMGPCWGQWCMHLTDDILFHSVYYNKERDNKSLSVSAYNKLGTMASHGCVRLTAGDSKWIYDNCTVGTKVTIYNNKKNPGPFDKPVAKKLSASQTWDPTDPAFRKKK